MVRSILYFVAMSLSFTMSSLKIVKIPRPGAKKILIVSFADIGGHASLTKALISFLKNTHEVHVIKSEDFQRYSDPNCDYYESMKISIFNTFMHQVKHHLAHKIVSKMSTPIMNLFFKLTEFNNLLDQHNYAMVILTSPIHVNAINRIFKKRRIPSITIVCDFGDPTIPDEFWIREECLIHIVPVDGYFKINKKHNVFSFAGIPIRREFSNIRRTSKRQAKHEIAVDPNQPCVLIMMGAAGANELLEIAEYVKLDRQKTYVFICGTNDEVYAKIKKMDVANFIVLKYVSKPMMYMRAADVFISKPGATSITESIQCETPCVFKSDSVFGFLPSEVPTARYIVEHGMGCVIHDYDELIPTINRIVETTHYFPYNNALEQSVHMIRRMISERDVI